MKKILLLLLCTTLFISGHAAVLTISQDADLPAQYTNINTAITAASVDDTLYIHGSVNSYNYVVSLNKRLVLIGPGHHPQTTSGFGVYINSIELYAPCNGSAIYGITTSIIQKVGGSQNDTLELTLKNCRFVSGGTGGVNVAFHTTKLLIENCIFESGFISFNWGAPFNRTGVVIRNNIFATVGGTGAPSIYQPRSNFLIDHNIFIGNNAASRAISEGLNCIISNNIFFGRTIDTSGSFNIGTNCSMLNNITYLCTNTLPTPGNSGSGNINADPQFVNFPATASPFSYSHDYHLQPSSPGNGAATDGTDIGAYSSIIFSMTGEPDELPVMRLFNIYNTTVPPGGTLDVLFNSSVPIKN